MQTLLAVSPHFFILCYMSELFSLKFNHTVLTAAKGPNGPSLGDESRVYLPHGSSGKRMGFLVKETGSFHKHPDPLPHCLLLLPALDEEIFTDEEQLHCLDTNNDSHTVLVAEQGVAET